MTRELRALRRQLDRRAEIDQVIADIDWSSLPAGGDGNESADPVTHGQALIDTLDYRYQPSCIGSCDMARVCRTQARDADAPCALGDEASNLLASTPTVAMAKLLADEEEPADAAEHTDTADVAQALRRARRAQLALVPPPEVEITGSGSADDWPLDD